jgi:hypothetical protein
MHRNCNATEPSMKTATLPSLRVDPQLRDAAQSVLQEGETVARGLASREAAQTTGVYFAAGDVHAELGQRLEQARAKVLNRKPARVQE